MTRPRELLLHPIAVFAVAVLVVNDHWLKAAHPGWLTGKLSDAAGLAFFPLLLLVLAGPRVPRAWGTVMAVVLATAIGFALVKSFPPATALFRSALGVLQWPFQLLADVLGGARLHGPVAVEAVTDPTDLLALPFTALAVVVARRGGYVDSPAPGLPGPERLVLRRRDQRSFETSARTHRQSRARSHPVKAPRKPTQNVVVERGMEEIRIDLVPCGAIGEALNGCTEAVLHECPIAVCLQSIR